MGSIFGRREPEPLSDEQRWSGQLPNPSFWRDELRRARAGWPNQAEAYFTVVRDMTSHLLQRIVHGIVVPRAGALEIVTMHAAEYEFLARAATTRGIDLSVSTADSFRRWSGAFTRELVEVLDQPDRLEAWVKERAGELLGLQESIPSGTIPPEPETPARSELGPQTFGPLDEVKEL